jgi:hypothetical protein
MHVNPFDLSGHADKKFIGTVQRSFQMVALELQSKPIVDPS